MCGVTGIVRESGSVADDLYASLIKLQHRAHDMTGAVTSDHGETYLQRGMGEVANVFTKTPVAGLTNPFNNQRKQWSCRKSPPRRIF